MPIQIKRLFSLSEMVVSNDQPRIALNIYKVPVQDGYAQQPSPGMVRQWQEAFYDGRTSESVFDSLPDFQLMAQAYGSEL